MSVVALGLRYQAEGDRPPELVGHADSVEHLVETDDPGGEIAEFFGPLRHGSPIALPGRPLCPEPGEGREPQRLAGAPGPERPDLRDEVRAGR